MQFGNAAHHRRQSVDAAEHQSVRQLATLREVSQVNRRLYRAFLLREALLLLYHLPDPTLAPAHLNAWRACASHCPFATARPVARAPCAPTAKASPPPSASGSPNGRIEGLNRKIRLVSYRACGAHFPDPLIAPAYLCCSGLTIARPR